MSNTHQRGIQTGSRCRRSKKYAVDSSQNLLSAFGTLENLNQVTGTEMCQIKAIGASKASQTKSLLEVEKRMASKPTRVKIKLKSSQAFLEKSFPFLRKLKNKIVKIVLLEPKLQFIKDLTISVLFSPASLWH